MEMKSYYLIILLIAFVICMGVFWFQFNNDVATFIMINETEVVDGGSFSGMLVDAYGNGVANQTITFHKSGNETGTIVDVTTDESGQFTVKNVEYLHDAGNNNYYNEFTFAGHGKYHGCTYEGNITIVEN